jgi:hypothetical protein
VNKGKDIVISIRDMQGIELNNACLRGDLKISAWFADNSGSFVEVLLIDGFSNRTTFLICVIQVP